MQTLQAFLRDETAFDTLRLPEGWGKYAVALVVLNEVRGVIVAGTIASQLWG